MGFKIKNKNYFININLSKIFYPVKCCKAAISLKAKLFNRVNQMILGFRIKKGKNYEQF
jgi:hypothetical protein